MGGETDDHEVEACVEQLVGACGDVVGIGLRVDLEMG